MAILSAPLGPVTITGDDARVFTHMLESVHPKDAAAATAERGRKMIAEFVERGVVAITMRPRMVRPSKGPDAMQFSDT